MVKAVDQGAPGGAGSRQRILDAASSLIAEIGWNRVTTRRIAARAGVNNALIHYYFRTKDALLLEAAAAVFGAEFEGPIARMLKAPTLGEGLEQFVDWLRSTEEHGPAVIVTIEALLQSLRDESVRAWIEAMLGSGRRLLEDVVVAAQERGEISQTSNPAGTAAILAALLDGLLLYRLADRQLDLDAIAEALPGLLDGSRKGKE